MTWNRPTPQQLRRQNQARRARSMKALVATAGKVSPGTYAGTTTGPAPKESVLESPAYERAVRDLGYCVRCQLRGRPQFCHRDEGKGMGIKTDVREGWAGCAACHYLVGTSGTLSKEERRAEDLRLGAITRAAVRAAGTWPRSVPEWREA